MLVPTSSFLSSSQPSSSVESPISSGAEHHGGMEGESSSSRPPSRDRDSPGVGRDNRDRDRDSPGVGRDAPNPPRSANSAAASSAAAAAAAAQQHQQRARDPPRSQNEETERSVFICNDFFPAFPRFCSERKMRGYYHVHWFHSLQNGRCDSLDGIPQSLIQRRSQLARWTKERRTRRTD